MKNLQRAVPCAYTFLQRNPEDQEMLQLMGEYKKEYDLNGFLIDYEERPFEVNVWRENRLTPICGSVILDLCVRILNLYIRNSWFVTH